MGSPSDYSEPDHFASEYSDLECSESKGVQRARNLSEYTRLSSPKGTSTDGVDSASGRMVRSDRNELQEVDEVDIGSPCERKQTPRHQFPELDKLRSKNAKIKRRTKSLKKAVKENRRLTELLNRQLTLLTTQIEEANSHLPQLGKIEERIQSFDRVAGRFGAGLDNMLYKIDTLDDKMDTLDDQMDTLDVSMELVRMDMNEFHEDLKEFQDDMDEATIH